MAILERSLPERRDMVLPFRRVLAAIASRRTMIALALTTAGWSLMWAQALAIVAIAPQWLCISMFFAGMLLIPFCNLDADPRSNGRLP